MLAFLGCQSSRQPLVFHFEFFVFILQVVNHILIIQLLLLILINHILHFKFQVVQLTQFVLGLSCRFLGTGLCSGFASTVLWHFLRGLRNGIVEVVWKHLVQFLARNLGICDPRRQVGGASQRLRIRELLSVLVELAACVALLEALFDEVGGVLLRRDLGGWVGFFGDLILILSRMSPIFNF